MRRARAAATTLVLGLAVLAGAAVAQQATEITFYYPIAVGGQITKIVDGYAEQFSKEHPSIKVKPVYTGTYQEGIVKALTAHKSGEPPTTAILLSTDMFTLIDEDAIVPWDELAKGADEQAWMKSFFPAFLLNSQTGGKTWGIPFQRSTIVLYWNKEIFKEVGLDPNKPPATWAEQVDFAKKLTKRDASGNVTRWGVQVPSSFEKKTAMMWTTTGNLTNVRNNAKFEFGVAMLPAGRHRGSPTGGGNFYVFKKAPAAQQQAAVKLAKWMTSPERAAQWGIDTGYVAVRPDAWQTAAMKKYVADFPAAAVARDQLQYAVAELSTHENQRVTKALNDGLQAALTGAKSPAQAMKDAQAEAERILRPYRR